VGTLNDYTYLNNPAKAADSRWVHRPRTDWEKLARRADPGTVEGRLYAGLRKMIAMRQANPVFGGVAMRVIETGNEHVFGYQREHAGQRLVALANFADHPQTVAHGHAQALGLGEAAGDWLDSGGVRLDGDLTLAAYQFLWLKA
jgi:amylosucrase